MDDADHVIVGSGINALVCAAMLGRKGRKVLVLERNDRIGGCIRTEEITAPGFVHDVMATTFVLFITSPAYAELGHRAGDFPIAEQVMRSCLSLPMFAELTDEQIRHVADAVKKAASAPAGRAQALA